LTQLTAVR